MFFPPLTWVSIEAIDCAPLSGAAMWIRLRAVPMRFTAASTPAVHLGPRNVSGSPGSSRETRGRTAPMTALAISAELTHSPYAHRPTSTGRAVPARRSPAGNTGRAVPARPRAALWMYPYPPGGKRPPGESGSAVLDASGGGITGFARVKDDGNVTVVSIGASRAVRP